jgi:GR25 family glycosyltransferase involved in LPS biosynthesis
MICFENAQGPGYMTEKPVQCFVAQTVPIYWGESSGLLNPEACIIVDPNNMHDAIQRVLQLDADDEAYAHMLKMGQTKPFMDKKPFDRNACYTYVKKIIVDEIAHPAIPPVIILSLKRRSEERRQAVLQECARVGFNSVSVFDAIDGSNIDEWALKQSLAGVLDPAAALTPGQLGCLASHVAIWRSLKSNGWTIVIEDDCRFHPNFTHEKLQELVKSIPAQAMMLRLAYLAAGPFAAHIGPVVNNWRQLSGPVFSTVAYAVHNSIIPLLLSYARKQPVDCQLPWGKCVYGAASLNSLPSFYEYDNPVIKTKETFYGIASVPHQLKSDTI